MPLIRGSSPRTIGRNIHEMFASGHPHAQAVAAALHEADEAKHSDADLTDAYWAGHAHGSASDIDLQHGMYADGNYPAYNGQGGPAVGNTGKDAWGAPAGPPGSGGNPNIGLGSGQGWSSPTQNADGTPMGGPGTGVPYGVNPGGSAEYGGYSNPHQGIFTGNKPAYTPGANAYDYGGTPLGAKEQQNTYAAAGKAALGQAAPKVSNAYGAADRAQNQGVQAGEQGMAAYYQNQLNGTGPSLASEQARASADAGIQSQAALANSARGPLAAAGAQRAAGQAGVGIEQNAAQQAVQGRIAEQQQAQAGLQGLYGQEGQQGLAQSAQDLQNAQYAAGLQEEQNKLGAATGLGYAGLGAQVGEAQLAAQEQQQQANLQAAGLGQQQSQFNTQQNNQLIGSAMGAGGALIGAFADADFKEPGGGASMTLREEEGGPHHAPFLAMIDRTSGRVGKVPFAPLTPDEHAQLYKPHGAGPLDSPQRQHTTVGGLGMGNMPASPMHDGDMNSEDQPMPAPSGDRNRAPHRHAKPQVAQDKRPDATPPAEPMPPRYGGVPGGALDLFGGLYGDAPLTAGTTDLGAGIGGQFALPIHGAREVPTDAATKLQALNDASTEGLPTKRDFDLKYGPDATSYRQQRAADPIDPKGLVGLQGAPGAAAPPKPPAIAPPGPSGGPVTRGFASNLPPGEQSLLSRGAQEERSALSYAEQAESSRLGEEARAAKIHGNVLQNQIDERADMERHAREESDRLVEAHQKHAAEAKDFGEHMGFHPTAAKRIGFAIASALGAAGASLTHGENSAAKIIDASISRELDAQKQKLEAKKGAVANDDSALASAYRRTGDMRQAMAIAHATALQESDDRAREHAETSNSQAVKAKYAMLHGQLDQQIAEKVGSHYKPTVTGGGGGPDLRKEYGAYYEAHQHPGDVAKPFSQWYAERLGGAGGAGVPKTGANGKPKPNPDAEALLVLANDPSLHGQDAYDRNAPRILRSSESLRNEAGLRALGNATSKAEGARAAPVTTPTSDVLESTIGRADEESVAAAKARARRLAEAKKHAGADDERDAEP